MALVVKSAIGGIAKKKGMRISGKTFEGLDKAVTALMEKAMNRAKDNNRKTIYPHDL